MSAWKVYQYTRCNGDPMTKLIRSDTPEPDLDYFVPGEWESAKHAGEVDIEDPMSLLDGCDTFDGNG